MRKSVLPWLACVIAALIAIPAFASGAATVVEPPTPAPSAPVAAPTVTFGRIRAPALGAADGAFLVKDNFFQNAGGDRPRGQRRGDQRRREGLVQPDRHPSAAQRRVHRPAAGLVHAADGRPDGPEHDRPAAGPPGFSSWTGECRFTTAGTYTFVCAQHAEDDRHRRSVRHGHADADADRDGHAHAAGRAGHRRQGQRERSRTGSRTRPAPTRRTTASRSRRAARSTSATRSA